MADLLGSVGGAISSFSWASMGNIVLVIAIFFFVLLVFGGAWFFMWWKSYNYKAKIYEPRGQVNISVEDAKKIMEEAKEGKTDTLEQSNIQFDMLKVKRTHGKYLTYKKTPYFGTFMPLKRHEAVPMELLFDDGVHLLKLSKDVFIPIPKPKTLIKVGQSVSISVTENNQWEQWNNMERERINNKYQDVDAQKRAVVYFVIGIAGMVIIGGFILWLIYSSVNKGFGAVDKLNSAVDSLTKGISGTAPK